MDTEASRGTPGGSVGNPRWDRGEKVLIMTGRQVVDSIGKQCIAASDGDISPHGQPAATTTTVGLPQSPRVRGPASWRRRRRGVSRDVAGGGEVSGVEGGEVGRATTAKSPRADAFCGFARSVLYGGVAPPHKIGRLGFGSRAPPAAGARTAQTMSEDM